MAEQYLSRDVMITMDGLENIVAGLGTSRDKMAYTKYVNTPPLTQTELENMYRTSWLSKRVVNVVAEDMTREWRQVSFDSDESDEQLAVEKEEVRLDVRNKINEAITWARLYGGSGIILGIRGTPIEQFIEPLDPKTVQKDGLEWIMTMDRHRLTGEGQMVEDLNSPYFGTPKVYMLTGLAGTVRIHHTRVIRFDGQRLPWNLFVHNGYWHDSELMHVYTSVRNNDTMAAGIATMLFEANVDVVKIAGFADLAATECGEQQIIKRFQLAAMMKSFNRTLLLDKEDEFDKKSNSFANLDKIWLQAQIDVCGAADIPMVRLFGQSASGLNATGDNDIRNYYDMISSKQEKNLKPQLNQLDECLIRSALGDMPSTYHWDFKSLWQLSDKETAETEKLRSERDAVYLDRGVVTEGVVARELKEKGTYPNLTEEDIKMAEELAEAVEEPEPEKAQPNPKEE